MSSPDLTANEKHLRLITCWDEFTKTGKLVNESAVRPVILESWKRSAAYGLDPENYRRIFADCDELLRKNRDLVKVAQPYMQLIQNFVGGSGFVVVLIDKEGYVLDRTGDPEVVDQANKNYLAPGENRNEINTGTNAIALALKNEEPIQISGPEHYSRNFHDWTCSCAPIRNSAGSLIGALNLSGHYSLVHKHTLGLVVSAVRAIERELSLIEAHSELLDTNKYLEAVIDSVADALLALTPEGRVIKANLRANIFLGQTLKTLDEVFEANSKIANMIKSGLGFTDVHHFFKSTKSYGLVTAKPISGGGGQVIGSLLIIKEKDKIHSLVNRIVGSTAAFSFDDIIGESATIKNCISLAQTAAQTDCKVLLEGESGTGKELFAQGIHNYSNRKNGPFIAVNCSAIPRELFESELFGYEEGAFSGANKKGKPGRFELAEGGTLFLDEASTISLDMQAKLLRILQENRIMRLGGINNIPLNVRLIVATNQKLADLINEGSFREDLYYRLSVFTLDIPPLRERKEDIPLLVDYFCQLFASSIGIDTVQVLPEVITALETYNWPGNIRQLQNVIERAVILSKGELNSLDYLPEAVLKSSKSSVSRVEEMESIKGKAILEALEKTNGNVTRAAKMLGVSRNTIYNKLKKK